MTAITQQEAASKTSKEAQNAWQDMGFHRHTPPRQGSRPRAKSGSRCYRIIVRPKEQFTSFITQAVDKPGRLLRLAGKRNSGSWATQAWLINKDAAHVEDRRLVADSKEVADLIRQLGSQPVHEKGDVFSIGGQLRKIS